MTAPELKPCPFCGGEAYLATPDFGGKPYVCCTANFCTGPKPTVDAVIAAWNTRTATIPDPMQDPRVVALVEALREYKKRARRIPFNVAIKADAALSTPTKEPPHE